jgi:hypothetical protein
VVVSEAVVESNGLAFAEGLFIKGCLEAEGVSIMVSEMFAAKWGFGGGVQRQKMSGKGGCRGRTRILFLSAGPAVLRRLKVSGLSMSTTWAGTGIHE